MSETLTLVGAVAGSIVTVSGSAFGAWWTYEARRRNRSPVIVAEDVWIRIVGAQRTALSEVDDCLHAADPRPTQLLEQDRKQLLVLREGRQAVDLYYRACRRVGRGYAHRTWDWDEHPVLKVFFFWAYGPWLVWSVLSDWRRRRGVRWRLRRAERSLTDISYLRPRRLSLNEASSTDDGEDDSGAGNPN
jgi:hypothetical protein